MSTAKQKLFYKKKKRLDYLIAGVVIIGVVSIGYILLFVSHAEGPYTSADPTTGTLTGNAAISTTATTALNSKSVLFSTGSTTTGSSGGCTYNGEAAPCVGTATTGASGWGTPTFNDTFADDNSTLNTKLWTPYWFSNGNAQEQNCSSTQSSNVSMSGGTLNLKLTSGNACGFVDTDPDDGVSGHTGFEVTPDNGSVYIEFKATLPAASASNTETANWPALWLAGTGCWPSTGEIDVMEGLGGADGIHLQYGPCNDNLTGGDDGAITKVTSGTHTFGIDWTTSGITGYYDGAEVWSTTYGSSTVQGYATAPEFLIMENSGGSYGGPSVVPSTMNVYYARVWQQ
jgi:hypothetical protein